MVETGSIFETLSFYYKDYGKNKGVLFLVQNHGRHSVQMIVELQVPSSLT
jgi:hypothetical protein